MESNGHPLHSGRSLSDLSREIPGVRLVGTGSIKVIGVTCDSRAVRPGMLFAALPGAVMDGSRFIGDALRRGASAVLTGSGVLLPKGTSGLVSEQPRLAMAAAASAVYRNPSASLQVIGITGTNGKTSTASMVRWILESAGIRCGLIGTITYEWGARRFPASRTTPEACDLQRMFREALDAGCQALVMEVSSQGLIADRLQNTRFASAVFTNLTEDHLDAHGTMDAYFDAKKRLFELLQGQADETPAVINMDDPWGRILTGDPGWGNRLHTYGLQPPAMIRAENVELTETASSFRVVTSEAAFPVKLPLSGRFNVSNALAAMTVCGAVMGIPLKAMASALATLPPISGRLERVADPKGRHLFVDYAHTEDALRNVLGSLRETSTGRLICLFGCGGDRDRTKRPRMGAVVSKLADAAVLTSDNPRSENPNAILEEVCSGMNGAAELHVEPDRARAIRLALKLARSGDTVLIAGKGHEAYQEVAGRMIPFDDRETVRGAILDGF